MRIMRTWLVAGAVAAALACDDNSTPTDGGTPPPSTPPTDGGNGGGAAPTAASVTVGNIFFQSARNGTQNPAIDTVAAGGTVTWTWTATGDIPHSVRSEGSPSFTSSPVQTGDGETYAMTFATAGSYQYDCAVHGSAMTGTIVVQ